VVRKEIALPTSQRRRKKHLARREEMVDAAMELVLDAGLDGLTIKKLADRLDAAVGAIYRYFPGKDELMVDLQQRAIEGFHETLKGDFAAYDEAHSGDSADVHLGRIAVVASSYLSDKERHPERHGLLDAVLSRPTMTVDDEKAMKINSESLAPLLVTACEKFDAAVAAGALAPGDSMLRMHLLWAAIHGLDHLQKRDRVQPEDYRSPALVHGMLASLFVGWGADPGEVEKALG
jgi:AcrR family transcriptional regulator